MHTSDSERIVIEYERRDRQVPADFYAMTRPVNMQLHLQSLRACVSLLRGAGQLPLSGKRLLDIGCGTGGWLLQFAQCDAEPALMAGIDLSKERIDRARKRLPQADLRVGCANRLPWPDQSFDLVTQFEAFTSILSTDLKHEVAREMMRVLKPDGAILWFDFRVSKPGNRQVKAIRKSEVLELFKGCQVRSKSALLAPPLARMVVGRCWIAGEILHLVPFLRTHCAAVILPAWS